MLPCQLLSCLQIRLVAFGPLEKELVSLNKCENCDELIVFLKGNTPRIQINSQLIELTFTGVARERDLGSPHVMANLVVRTYATPPTRGDLVKREGGSHPDPRS